MELLQFLKIYIYQYNSNIFQSKLHVQSKLNPSFNKLSANIKSITHEVYLIIFIIIIK